VTSSIFSDAVDSEFSLYTACRSKRANTLFKKKGSERIRFDLFLILE